MGQRRVALWAAISPLLAAVLAAIVGLADNAIPKSWGWAHSEVLLWSIVGAVVIASAGVSVVQAWVPAAHVPRRGERTRAGTAGRPGPSGQLRPVRGQRFAGRTRDLTKLAWLLAEEQAIVLRGSAGTGKSLLALEYARQMRASGRYQLVGWVPADSPASIVKGLAALAPLLGLLAGGTAGETAAQVVAALRSRRGWLVVFDDAQKPGDLMEMWPGEDGHVLITSRNRGWNGIAAPMDLGGFSRAESVRFLCERSGSDEPEAAAGLAGELGDFPLALAQAAHYIDKAPMTIRDYLQLYRDPAEASALRDSGLDPAEYPASVTRTMLLLFRQLGREHPAAVKLLCLCAFLDPGDIDLELLSVGHAAAGKALGRVLRSPWERAKAVRVLAAVDLVTVKADGHLQVPRLVQAVTRDSLSGERAAKWARRALNLINAIVPLAPADHRSWPLYATLAPHIRAVAEAAGNYPRLAGKIGLLNSLGIYFSASEQPEAARTAFEAALATGAAAGDAEAPGAAEILDHLAIAQWQGGEFGEALASNERALAGLSAAYGPDHPETARSLGIRGVIQLGSGAIEAARESFEEALVIFLGAYEQPHPDVARTLHNLGKIRLRMSEPKDAKLLLEEALVIFGVIDRAGHREVAETLMSLSLAQRELGELREAQAGIEQAVALLRATYGPRHPVVATALANLGVVRRQSRDLKGAYISIRQALTIFHESYGPDRHALTETLFDLGVLHRRKIVSNLASHAMSSRIMRLDAEDPQLKAAA